MHFDLMVRRGTLGSFRLRCRIGGGGSNPAPTCVRDIGVSVEGPGVIRNVQLLRAVAACAVLYSHAADRIFETDDWRFSIEWRAGVDLFFVISGFVMTVLAAEKF